MKIICYIDSMQMGGAQRVMNNLLSYLSGKGHKVILINDIVPVEGIPEYEIDDSIERLYLDKQRKYRNSAEKNIARIRKLREYIKLERPDTVLSFIGPPNIRMLMATIGIKTRKIVSVRNDPNREYGKGKRKIFARTVFNLADGCVFQTQEAALYFSESLRRRSTVIYNPVSEVFFNTERCPDNKTIVMVGRLNAQKNYPLAIDAFALLANDYRDVTLRIYGEGDLRDKLQYQISKLGLEGRVVLEGRNKAIEEKLSSAMAFLMTSDYEGMPNALMEAMVVGVPAIVTDCPCGGPRELISDASQGILVKCGQAEEVANALKRIIDDKSLRELMYEGERKRAKDFHPHVIMGEWDRFLFVER